MLPVACLILNFTTVVNHAKKGGVHNFVMSEENQSISHSKPQFSDFLLTKENSVHMLWLVPQVFVITVGEILFSVTALEFSYYQAPISMKSVVQANDNRTLRYAELQRPKFVCWDFLLQAQVKLLITCRFNDLPPTGS